MAIIRTRVADDTWVFTSRMYVEVNAGLVVTPEGGILIDTLPFPSETQQIIAFARAFVRRASNMSSTRSVTPIMSMAPTSFPMPN